MGDNKLLKEMGLRIKEIRKAKKITQEQLAEKMDVSTQMISNLELGKKAVRPENIVKLCEILNTSSDYVLRGIRAGWETTDLITKYNKLSPNKQHIIEQLIDELL